MSLDTLEPASATSAEEVIALWPGEPPEPSPGGVGPEISYRNQAASGAMTTMLRNVVTPTLTVFRADPAKANGVGVIVCPGGGWRLLAWEHEGLDVARWLAARGYTAFVLKYRLRPTEPDPDAYAKGVAELTARITAQVGSMAKPARTSSELLGDKATLRARAAAAVDGRRALALVRERAGEWGVDPARVGLIGFSAGAFLVADVAVDPQGTPPAFVAPIYGGETRGDPVPPDAPPLFTVIAQDDRLLFHMVEGLYLAWSDADRSAELHIFGRGAHGFGLIPQGMPSDRWIDLFDAWLADNGFG